MLAFLPIPWLRATGRDKPQTTKAPRRGRWLESRTSPLLQPLLLLRCTGKSWSFPVVQGSPSWRRIRSREGCRAGDLPTVASPSACRLPRLPRDAHVPPSPDLPTRTWCRDTFCRGCPTSAIPGRARKSPIWAAAARAAHTSSIMPRSPSVLVLSRYRRNRCSISNKRLRIYLSGIHKSMSQVIL